MNASDILFTNHFRALVMMYDHQVVVGNEKFSKITQVEISDQLGVSKVTVNHIMRDLMEKGFVVKEEKRIGKYYLSKEAEEIVEKLRQVDKLSNGYQS